MSASLDDESTPFTSDNEDVENGEPEEDENVTGESDSEDDSSPENVEEELHDDETPNGEDVASSNSQQVVNQMENLEITERQNNVQVDNFYLTFGNLFFSLFFLCIPVYRGAIWATNPRKEDKCPGECRAQ